MKAKILIIIFLSTFSLIGKSQNLISNPSFEVIGTPAFPFPQVPWIPGMLSYSQDWYSLAEFGDVCGGFTGLTGSTPDLFKVGTFTTFLQGINAHSGDTYVGMNSAEIIQQKLSQPLSRGRYKIKFFMRGKGGSLGLVNGHQPVGCGFPIPSFASGIKVFVHSSKIKYDASALGFFGGFISDTKEGNLQSIAFITAPNDAQLAWTEVSSEFFVEDTNIEWIGLEGIFADPSFYTLIDDVSLEKIPCNSCTASCNPESGCIEAGIAYTNTCNLEVVKLGNASSLDIRIASVNGSIQYRNIHIDHPTCRVRYDGRNQAGVDLAAGLYVMSITVKNGCGILKTDRLFSKWGAWTGPDCLLDPIDYSTLSASSKINPKLVCCPDNLSIGVNTQITDIATTAGGIIKCLAIGEYLTQQSFFSLPPLNLKAKQAIVIDPGISSMKNITFRSPKITINGSTISPHIIYPGATFKTEIDCPLGLKDDDNDEVMYFKGSTKETNFSNNITLKDNFTLDNYKLYDDSPNFKLSPNPNDGKFQITVSNNTDLLGYSAEIIDFSGRKVLSNQKLSSHSQLIDLSSHPNGLYIIKIYKNNIVFWISKILKTN